MKSLKHERGVVLPKKKNQKYTFVRDHVSLIPTLLSIIL